MATISPRFCRFFAHLCILAGLTGLPQVAWAQKVALVMSGGGAKGLAYVRIIKALEANGIPIDYVVGTSMGGLVGAFYAAGYSPEEMEALVLSDDFQNWVNGRVEKRYFYHLYRREPDGAALNLKVGLSENFGAVLQTSLVNDDALNMALAERLAPASARAGYVFDSLFVPFRCMAADVFTQRPVTLRNGNLSDAARATMNVPLFFKPVKVYNQYLFDGGIYNNFPVDVAQQEFAPEVIIGVNVSDNDLPGYPYQNDDEYLAKLMSYLLIAKTDSLAVPANGVYIKPPLGNLTATQFDRVEQLLEAGERAAASKLAEIKAKVARRVDKVALDERRRRFRASCPPLVVGQADIVPTSRRAPKYVGRMFPPRGQYTLDQLKRNYFRVSQTEHFDILYPSFSSQPGEPSYCFRLQYKPADHFKVSLGGAMATRNISQLYVGLRYDYADRVLYNLATHLYTGPFYTSGNLRARLNFPGRWAYYLEPSVTYNSWDFLRSTEIFSQLGGRDQFALTQRDARFDLDLGLAAGSRGKATLQYSRFWLEDSYSHSRFFTSIDTFSLTQFEGQSLGIVYQQGSLNRKMYASAGGQVSFLGRFVQGREAYLPGSDLASLLDTALRDRPVSRPHQWFRLKLVAERYFALGRRYSLGLLGEGVYSTQPVFSNYMATMAAAPAFAPLPDSRTLFLPEFRSFWYAAGGLRGVARLGKNLELRAEGYGFVNFQPLAEVGALANGVRQRPQAQLGSLAQASLRKAGLGALVYHSVAGPISLGVYYYDDLNPANRWGALLHVGFLLFNRRPLE
jgi:NTE family protein